MSLRHTRIAAAAALLTALLLLQPLPGQAQGVDLGLVYASGIGLPDMDVRDIATRLIRTALGFAGFLMVLQILQGGLKMMTHGGSAEGHNEAVETIKGGIIGMIVIMMSSAIVNFVVTAVVNASYNYL